MNVARLFVLMPLIFTFAILHAPPWMPRRAALFGVAVPGPIRYGIEGRRLWRGYQVQLLPWTVSALVCALFLPTSWQTICAVGEFMLPTIVAARGLSRGRAAVRAFAVPPPLTREADLTNDAGRPLRLLPAYLVPLAVLAGAAVYLHICWDDIPIRFPVHWSADGTPNGWSERTVPGVYGPLVIGAAVIFLMGGISAVTAWGSRMSTQHPAAQAVPVVVAVVIATAFSMAALLPLHFVPLWGVLVFQLASLIVIGVTLWWSARRHTGRSEVTPDICWYQDCFYSNPEDPALFVEKRVGVGWTFNFGHRASWILLGLMLLLPAALVFLAFRFNGG